ncbi:MAG TPA: DUF3298 domain-containing protein [Dysgonamonadaceae bacterium]|nr:DUF3298 domain-containing protein [Dysgonamonadaceae bacterium]
MKRNKIVFSVLMLTMGLSLMSCVSNKTKNNKIEFDKLEINEKVFLLQENDTTLPYSDVKLEFTFPVKFNNNEDLERLQQIFTGTFFNDESYDTLSPKDALNEYFSHYTAEYQTLTGQYYKDKESLESDQMPSWYWYYHYKTNEILFHDNNIVSYSVEHSDYTGGAHGSLNALYYIIDLNNLTTITEEDIFKPNYHHFLTSKIIEMLMKKHDVAEADELMGEGFFDINEIAPNNNFWINNEGVHYVYNQYEIAPYSMGPIEIAIPFEEITPIIIPESIAGEYIK